MKTTRTNVVDEEVPASSSVMDLVEQQQTCPFIDNLKTSVERNGGKKFASWHDAKGKVVHSYTVQQMWEEAGQIAHIIRVQNGLQKGDRVVLCYSFGLRFFAAFLGCIRAGVLAVPVYPPNPQKLDKSLAKLNQIIQDCSASLLLIDSLVSKLKFTERIKSFFSFSGATRNGDQWNFANIPFQVHPEAVFGNHTASFDEESLIESDIAFLQYTSGSTGDPKGVMITFKSINANVTSFIQFARNQFGSRGKSEEDIMAFSWLPQYHDMGLICLLVGPFIGGWDIHYISPVDFISNPMLWIQLMSKLRVNWCGAPNFAYNLVAKKFLEARRKNPSFGNDLDLSSIVTLHSAAEPIQIETKEIFEKAFSDVGLPSTWFGSGYGLAENVAWANALDHLKLSKLAPREGQPIVAVGHRIIGESPPGQIIKIVSTESNLEVEDGEVGEIWISGPCVAGGYFGKPGLSKDTFEATLPSDSDIDKRHYLRTGDLGFYEDDYLYICGRQKDLIIINGENIYPQDVENVVQNASSGVKPGCIAAFAQDECGVGSERLEIIFEIRKSHEKKCKEVIDSVRTAVVEEIGLVPHRLVAIRERTIRKTTSGKIQRRANRAALHDGSLTKVVIFDLINEQVKQDESLMGRFRSSIRRAHNNTNDHLQDDVADDAKRDQEDLYYKVVSSFLGNNVDMDKTWDELGLSSLVSIQLSDALSDHFWMEVDVLSFQKYTTPRLMQQNLINLEEIEAEEYQKMTKRHELLESLVDTDAMTRHEQRMLYIHMTNPSSNSYNMPFSVRFRHNINVRENLQSVIDSIPIFRTRFVNGKATEDVHDIVIESLQGGRDCHSSFDVGTPFDLMKGPLCRFAIDDDKNILHGCIHHSIADGRSMDVLLEAVVKGQVKEATKAYSIRRYAALEGSKDITDEYNSSVEKWKGVLGDTPSRLEVDFAHDQTSTEDTVDDQSPPCTAAHTSMVTLDADTIAELQVFCRERGVSMFAMALSSLHHTLRAYSHEAYTIGVAHDVRPRQFRDSIGMFVNTVLVPFGGDKEGGWESVQDIHDRWTKDILPIASTPFDMVSSLEYGCNIYLAYNVGMLDTESFQKDAAGSPAYMSVDWKDSSNPTSTDAMFDLTVSWSHSADDSGSLNVSFESGIGEWPRLEERFLQVLHGLTEKAKQQSSNEMVSLGDGVFDTSLSLLPDERSKVLKWGQGERKHVRQECLHEIFQKQARTNPQAIALYDKQCTMSMTYGELDRRSDKLASRLRTIGAKSNTFVGLLMSEKTFDLCVCVLGILKSGAAFVPMDPVRFPAERTGFIIGDTEMDILVTVRDHEGYVEGVLEHNHGAVNSSGLSHVVFADDEVLLDEANDTLGREDVSIHPATAENYAYMIYTSGTTGKPKGVICNHLGPMNMIDFEGFFQSSSPEKDIVGCSAPIIFDTFVEGFFGSLGCGLSFSLDLKHCTVLDCTPAIAPLLLSDPTNQNVRKLLVGGEACTKGLEKSCEIFCNTYGPTECSIICTKGISSSTIGIPLPNALCYVVHPDDGTLCPPGVSGELWIGGVGVSLGYHNRPDLSAEKFIPNPFLSPDANHPTSPTSHLLYKSGDRVKWNEDGELVYLGRFDHQVKVRGYRIELGDIQAELEKHDGVSGALAMVHDEKIIAYVVPSDNHGNNTTGISEGISLEDALLEALQKEDSLLPSYMVSWKIIKLDAFPLTANGKIERRRMSLPRFRSSVFLSSNLPESDTEKYLCSLFNDIIGIDAAGINHSFSYFGGHSLHVMQAVLQIRSHFGIDSFSARDFISLGTARAIASHIDSTLAHSSLQEKENEFSTLPEQTRSSIESEQSTIGKIDRLSSLLMKPLAVLVLWLVLWISVLPSYYLISRAINLRLGGGTLNQGYLSYIGTINLAILTVVLSIFAFSYLFCQALRRRVHVIQNDQTIIRRNSSTYALWYIFDRLWLVTSSVANFLLSGTIFSSGFYRLFGAKTGSQNFFADVNVRLPFLLETGDNVVVGTGAKMETLRILNNGDIAIGRLELHDNVVICPNTHIGVASSIGSSSMVRAVSRIPEGSRIPMNTIVEGTFNHTGDDALAKIQKSMVDTAIEDQNATYAWHLLALLVMHLPTIFYALYFIGIYSVLYQVLSSQAPFMILVVIIAMYPLMRILGQIIITLIVIPLRLCLNWGRAKSRCTKLYSTAFLRQWLASKLSQSCTPEMGGIISRCSQRLLGADIDIHCGFSPLLEEPQLTRTGSNVFCANGVKLCNLSFYPGGIARFGSVSVGDSSMILDRSVLETHTKIENNVMVASLTAVTNETSSTAGSLLIGSPALHMINNNTSFLDNDMEIKSEPLVHSLLLYFIGTYYELVVIMLPILLTAYYLNAYIFARVLSTHSAMEALGISFVLLPASVCLIIMWLLLSSIMAKWLILGNAKKKNQNAILSVDSQGCFLWHLSNALVHMSCSLPLLLVNEFWLTRAFWNLMGANIGKGAAIDPDVLMFEADLLEIGDDSRIEEEATLLCHKFSNGGLEFAPIVIPSGTFVGSRAVILPGCKIADEGIQIMALTHVLPGEELAAGTWHGSPAEKITDW